MDRAGKFLSEWIVKQQGVLILFVLLIFVSILLELGGKFDFVLIDYTHYIEAARRLTSRVSPYKELEYFSPPWFALLLIPLTYLPNKIGTLVWLVFLVISNFLSVVAWLLYLDYPKSSHQKPFVALLFTLATPSLYTYITGQVSPLVLLSLTFLILRINCSWMEILTTSIGATFKPHLSVLTIFLYLMESFRQRRIYVFFWMTLTVLLLIIISTWFYSNWLEEWVLALIEGDYRGGPGLVSTGYFGFREGRVPIWLLVLPVFYAILTWYKEGTTPYVLSFSLVSNLLVIPYHRAYDYILLYPACLYILAHSPKSISNLAAKSLALLSVFVIPFSPLVLLSPILVLVALLITRVMSAIQPSNERKNSPP
ncbi:MAG: DUF2029 domain-containing protein [Anaerolineales bacterium]|nr:DUF2029 domain-containing protein [Anaerolineales bacterium]